MENTTDIREQENNIMSSANLTDMEKLSGVFQLRKSEIKEQFPQLFYCILGVLNSQKIGAKKLPEADLSSEVRKAVVSKVSEFGDVEVSFEDGSTGVLMRDMMTLFTHRIGDVVMVKHIHSDYYRLIATESNRFSKE